MSLAQAGTVAQKTWTPLSGPGTMPALQRYQREWAMRGEGWFGVVIVYDGWIPQIARLPNERFRRRFIGRASPFVI
jgi:hypothetical protein